VTARAEGAVSSARDSRTSIRLSAALVLLIACRSAPAAAEVGFGASLFSDERFRGYSLSNERPVAMFDFAYDNPSGFYADGAATAVFRHGIGPAPLRAQLSGGYAKRLGSGTTLDFGVTHSTYSHYSSGGLQKSYSEIYAGIARGTLSSRIFLSPHYFQQGRWTAYGEINGNFSPAQKWELETHLGMLVPLRAPSPTTYRTNLDWRLGMSRELGRFSLHAAWVGHARAPQPFASQLLNSRPNSRNALVLGITAAL
jgi:uncharacterized protein (TIGR02001 family)